MSSPFPDSPTPVGMYSKGLSRDTPSTVASTPTPHTPLPPAAKNAKQTWLPEANPETASRLGRLGPTSTTVSKVKSAIGSSSWRNRSNSKRKKPATKDKQKDDKLPAAPPIVREASSGKSVNLSMTGGSREGAYELKRDRFASERSGTMSSTPPRPYKGLESERVSRCTRETVWNACDVFWQFDVNWTGEITRKSYIDGLADPPTIEKLRTLRRAQVEQRFRSSARPITLKDWITMLWQKVPPKDLDLMMRWAELREAYTIVHHKRFRCHESEMNRVYFLLDVEPGNRTNREDSKEEVPRGSGDIPLGELVRAKLLTPEEVFKLFRDKRCLHETIGKEAFKSQAHPHFKNTYVTADTKSRMKQEEEAMQNISSLNSGFSSNLFGAQAPAS